jgi:myo-inositol-1(or 4)-monophosphatase
MTDFGGGHFQLNSEEVLASNELIHEELVGLFADMFAGRDLTPIPSAREFAERRAVRAALA